MSDKKFYELIIGLLKSIDENTKGLKEVGSVYIDGTEEPIAMSEEVYDEICEELDENDITFMGIS
tara:strand:+ start:769 stop:963 length:195 start_codon:yes stop_codon:yes gene_type:complete